MTQGQAKADGCSIVEDVKSIANEAEDPSKALHHLSQMIKGVFEGFPIRRLGEAKTWQIRRHHVIAISECWDKLPIHVRGGGKAVQQQHHRLRRITGFAIEHLQSIDRNGSVSGGRDKRRVLSRALLRSGGTGVDLGWDRGMGHEFLHSGAARMALMHPGLMPSTILENT